MGEEFDVRPEAFRTLSYDVTQFDDRLRGARAAASTTLSEDAFGPMLNFFGVDAPDLAITLETSLGSRATEMHEAAQNLRNQAGRHDNSDAEGVNNIVKTVK